MSAATDGSNAGQSNRQTGEADSLVADQSLTGSERHRDRGARPQSEARQAPEGVLAGVQEQAQALKVIDSRHEWLQTMPAGALGAMAAREAATSDVAELSRFTDKALQARAAAVLGDTADHHLAYKSALREASPQYAGLAERAYADDQQRSVAKEDRKAFEFADRRDDAADSIAARYTTMARAGLTVKDLQGPALDRLAIKDSRDLLLIDGLPPHPRAGEAQTLVADSLKSDAYRATFDRETAEWSTPGVGRQPGISSGIWPRTATIDSPEPASQSPASPADAKQSVKTPVSAERPGTETNSIRSDGDIAEKRRASLCPVPPLEDRFNVKRIGLVEKEYHFRDQAGKVAFTDKFMSMSTGSESPAAIKAMVDRAAERGWETVRLNGSPEFVRQGWIAATAQGLKAVGHTVTAGDREAAAKERVRLQINQDAPTSQRPGEAIVRVQSAHIERVSGDRTSAALSGQRQLAAAIEKALADGKVSPELRGQVRAMMTAEGAKRVARGDRFKVPVYDSRAPRVRSKSAQTVAHRSDNRERLR